MAQALNILRHNWHYAPTGSPCDYARAGARGAAYEMARLEQALDTEQDARIDWAALERKDEMDDDRDMTYAQRLGWNKTEKPTPPAAVYEAEHSAVDRAARRAAQAVRKYYNAHGWPYITEFDDRNTAPIISAEYAPLVEAMRGLLISIDLRGENTEERYSAICKEHGTGIGSAWLDAMRLMAKDGERL